MSCFFREGGRPESQVGLGHLSPHYLNTSGKVVAKAKTKTKAKAKAKGKDKGKHHHHHHHQQPTDKKKGQSKSPSMLGSFERPQ